MVHESRRNYQKSLIYGIYHRQSNELLYVGSTIDAVARTRAHTSAIRTGTRTRLYDYIRAENVRWDLRIIEAFPCDFLGQLLAREYQTIETLRPWYNVKRYAIYLCTANCGRPLLTRGLCDVCNTFTRQLADHRQYPLVYKPGKGERTCFLCKSYGVKDYYGINVDDAGWDKIETNDPMSSEIPCYFCRTKEVETGAWTVGQLFFEWGCCPLTAVRMTNGKQDIWLLPKTAISLDGLEDRCGQWCRDAIDQYPTMPQ